MFAWMKYLGVEDAPLDTFYHRLIRQELIDLFSSPRKRVIEIGSSGGYTGQYCKEKFPGVEYWGFELNKAAARESLGRIDKVVCGKFEEQDLTLLGLEPHSIDGVVLGDVLEHMYDPWHTLTALLPWLSADAEVIVSLPNLRNLWLLNEIAEGRFSYDANGLLDVTHIRFFTLQEINTMMATTGYLIEQGGMSLDARLQHFFTQYQAQCARLHGRPCDFRYRSITLRATGETLAELCARQFIFRARPRPALRERPATQSGAQQLAADYDTAFLPDAQHHVPALAPAPDTPRSPVSLFAFYLPQFHPTPHNDQWWGPGFTEWTNVSRARPLFDGHYQPRHPGELGYYDLRVPDVMARQAELARQAGLAGFIFYYYWFSGQRMLEMPLAQYMQRQAELGLPFMVMWCNENWRRTWVDKDRPADTQADLLMAHQHRPDDPERFMDDLHPVLSHPGYVRVDGKPVLLMYPLIGVDGSLADAAAAREFITRCRIRAREIGLGELLVGAHEKSNLIAEGKLRGPQDLAADFFFDFPPPNSLTYSPADNATGIHRFYDPAHEVQLVYYETLMDKMLAQPDSGTPWVKTVLAGSWDNTARKGLKANIFHGCTPALYERWLREAARHAQARPALPGKPMVFINAWNEWAEGVYLEPDRKFGYALLAATQRVACGLPPQG
ncbi:MAG: glycoside hydrolase family 99-like domain-containing protein [Ottowia sp.]